MKDDGSENVIHILHQSRTLLILTVMMLMLSIIIDPPFSTIGIVLVVLSLIVLVFVTFRIHRSVSGSKSSSLTS